MPSKLQPGKTQRTLSNHALGTKLVLQAREVEMLRAALDAQSNRIAVYKDCAPVKPVKPSK